MEYGVLEINYLAVRPEPVEGERLSTTQCLKGEGSSYYFYGWCLPAVGRGDEPSCKIRLI